MVIHTIWEDFMYKTFEYCKNKIIEKIDEKIKELETEKEKILNA